MLTDRERLLRNLVLCPGCGRTGPPDTFVQSKTEPAFLSRPAELRSWVGCACGYEWPDDERAPTIGETLDHAFPVRADDVDLRAVYRTFLTSKESVSETTPRGHKTPSSFAKALAELLRYPDGITYEDWADIINVSLATIEKWLADETLPPPDKLHMIVNRIRELKSVPKEALRQFYGMATRPGRRVSPHGQQLHPNVACYMLGPLRDSLTAALAAVDPRAQEELILQFIRQCREFGSRTTDGVNS